MKRLQIASLMGGRVSECARSPRNPPSTPGKNTSALIQQQFCSVCLHCEIISCTVLTSSLGADRFQCGQGTCCILFKIGETCTSNILLQIGKSINNLLPENTSGIQIFKQLNLAVTYCNFRLSTLMILSRFMIAEILLSLRWGSPLLRQINRSRVQLYLNFLQ